ncbi:MAG: ParB/RepB/Spo0J family partition protein [Succinivibrio sp.]
MAGLGRGLSSLLSEAKKAHEESEKNTTESNDAEVVNVTTPATETLNAKNSVVEIETEKLKASVYQPRKNFDDESLNELSESIKEHGLLEPLLVKKSSEDDRYEIICGERRYRACKIAGIEKIPCLVRDDLETNSYAVALIENIQREDLNPLEMSRAFALMIEECSLSQEELAKTLGKSRSSVANILRLNNLQDDVKELVEKNQLSLGHAKVILSLDSPEEQLKAALYVIKKDLSVRQTESLVKSIKENGIEEDTESKSKIRYTNDNFENWSQELSSKLSGIKVKFNASSEDKGKVTLSYTSKEQLESLISFFNVE